jgi:hypothetical protein
MPGGGHAPSADYNGPTQLFDPQTGQWDEELTAVLFE